MRVCKSRKCKECQEYFTPMNSTNSVCGWKCALLQVNRINERKATIASKKVDSAKKRDIALRKLALKSKSDHLRDAQAACNAYIRERDGKICISCGTQKPDIQYCAGHYKTRGAHPSLRFHPFNISSQCNKRCNLMLSGNISDYRPNLINKIGLSNVEWLEGPHESQNLTIDDIKEIKEYYREQLKILKKAHY